MRILLTITDFDLYKTSHRFVFGDADETQGLAIVSVHRLRSRVLRRAERREPALSADAQGVDSRAGARIWAQTLLQRALRDVLLKLDLRDRQQDAALL